MCREALFARAHRLPPLGASLQIIDATMDGENVALRLRHDGIRHALRLEALHTVIRDRATKLTEAVFG